MFYLTAKFHKNRINGLEDISGRTYVRTYGRTYGRDSLGLKRLRRETKNQTILMNQSEENWRKPHF